MFEVCAERPSVMTGSCSHSSSVSGPSPARIAARSRSWSATVAA
jgi:hypothetical protein